MMIAFYLSFICLFCVSVGNPITTNREGQRSANETNASVSDAHMFVTAVFSFILQVWAILGSFRTRLGTHEDTEVHHLLFDRWNRSSSVCRSSNLVHARRKQAWELRIKNVTTKLLRSNDFQWIRLRHIMVQLSSLIEVIRLSPTPASEVIEFYDAEFDKSSICIQGLKVNWFGVTPVGTCQVKVHLMTFLVKWMQWFPAHVVLLATDPKTNGQLRWEDATHNYSSTARWIMYSRHFSDTPHRFPPPRNCRQSTGPSRQPKVVILIVSSPLIQLPTADRRQYGHRATEQWAAAGKLRS